MKREPLLPAPPAIIAKVVQLAAQADCDAHELARVLRTDPSLSASILRMANSALYGFAHKVSTVERALALLGIRTVRNLVLCFGVRGMTPVGVAYPIDLFWEFSVRRAASAREIGRRLSFSDPEQLFTTALCQDLGVLALAVASDTVAERLAAVARAPAAMRLGAEQALGEGHDTVTARLFSVWQFPEELTCPVRYHHAPALAPEPFRHAAAICQAAEALADLLTVEDRAVAMGLATSALVGVGLPEATLGGLVEAVATVVTQTAEALQIRTGEPSSYAEIAAAACEGLLELNSDYESQTAELRQRATRQQRVVERLAVKNQQLVQWALTDELTGLSNRRAFDDTLGQELAAAATMAQPLCLLLGDIDHFKQVNDTYGHAAGDAVLQAIGHRIRACCRAGDFPARYGGEEFAVILPETSAQDGQRVAERIRGSIAAQPILAGASRIDITISFGVAEVSECAHPRAGVLGLRRADDALYAAKEAGRNRVMVAPNPPRLAS